MYADFFGFRELPFNNTPDPRFFYSTPDHEEALASLIYAVRERKGFVLLTGEVGAGKTLVTRLMLRHFGTHVSFANVNHAVQGSEDLLESICSEFDLPVQEGATPAQIVRQLHDYLLEQFAQNIPVVLVLDEAQNLPTEGFEQLRMIGNLEADDAKLLQIAIVGQPELQEMFRAHELRQLRQRIFRNFHLQALSRESTEAYILHRLSVVCDEETAIFDAGSIDAIYKASRGVPRIINTMCDNALLSAYSSDRRHVSAGCVHTVIKQMGVLEFNHGSGDGASQGNGQAGKSSSTSKSANATQNGPEPTAKMVAQFQQRVLDARDHLKQPRPAIAAVDHASPQDSEPAGDGISQLIQNEMQTVSRAVWSKIGKAVRRIDLDERGATRRAADVREARALDQSLRPLLRQARSVVDRAESASRALLQREKQLQTLAASVKDVVGDLRQLLDRANDTSSKSNQCQRRALAIHARLASQMDRSRELAAEIKTMVDTGRKPSRLKIPETLLLSERTVAADSTLAPVSEARMRGDRNRVEHLLQNAKESLADLRDISKGPPVVAESDVACEAIPATTRLARKVDDLLELVEPGGVGETTDSAPAG